MPLEIIAIIVLLIGISIVVFIKSRHVDRWIIPYIHSLRNKSEETLSNSPTHIYVALCDHFEPFWGKVSQEIAEHRVATWCREYPRFVKKHTDSLGRRPVHTFFYAEEDYNPQFLDSIHKLCKEGIADVEIHIRHDKDCAANFKRRIEGFRDVLYHHHNLLRKDHLDRITYGFIHGNWALNNSRPDGKWCGINNEIPILKDTGCYADFTFPSAPDITQPPIINSIYFSPDIPGQPGSHEQGYMASIDNWSEDDQLLIQGPLSLNWYNRNWGLIPRIENGELSNECRVTPERVKLWLKTGVHVKGRPNHVFIKLHAHGAIDSSIRYFFGEEGLSYLWTQLESQCNDGERYILHYVSAWEMYKTIKNLCKAPPVMSSNDIR